MVHFVGIVAVAGWRFPHAAGSHRDEGSENALLWLGLLENRNMWVVVVVKWVFGVEAPTTADRP